MKIFRRIPLTVVVILTVGLAGIFAQNVTKRDVSDLCDGWEIQVSPGVWEAGHISVNNFATQDFDGYLAVISRDDLMVPQAAWDCHNDQVTGTIFESMSRFGVPTVHAVLKYETPLEVWTVYNGTLGEKVVDNGLMRLNLVMDFYIFYPGAPLDLSYPVRYRIHASGIGYAYGTGLGEFEPGELVEVKLTEEFMYLPQTPQNSAVGRDGWPIEKIQLTLVDY